MGERETHDCAVVLVVYDNDMREIMRAPISAGMNTIPLSATVKGGECLYFQYVTARGTIKATWERDQ